MIQEDGSDSAKGGRKANLRDESRSRDVQQVPDLHSPGIQAGVGRQQRLNFDSIFAGDGKRRFAGLHLVGPRVGRTGGNRAACARSLG